MERIWYWAMPTLGALVGAGVIYTLGYLLIYNNTPDGWGLQAAITFVFFFPGLLLSLGVSQIILSRRKPRQVFASERILIGTLVIASIVLALSCIDDDAYIGLLIGPIIIIVAIALTITIIVNSVRAKDAVVVPAVWTQPAEAAALPAAPEAPAASAPVPAGVPELSKAAEVPAEATEPKVQPASPYGPASDRDS